jgi:glucan phosphoethanolaminetransferase (alkaline phosphatase superfamily)
MFSKTSHYGIALGILNILFFLLQYQQNVHTDPLNVYVILMLPISVIFIILAIVKASKDYEGELFSIRKGLQTGIGVILLGGFIIWGYQIFHANFIEPDFIDKLAAAAPENLKLNEQFSPEEIIKKLALFKENYKFNLFSDVVLKSLFTGFFVSLITSLVINAFYKQR